MKRNSLTGQLHDLAAELRRAARTAGRGERRGHVQVTRRSNVQTAINVGSPGSSQHASAQQNAPIDQHGA